MNGDLSRVTFNPLKHFTSIVWQQGRVQMDADGNEQTAILLHYLRGLAADLIGQHGGPNDLLDSGGVISQRNCGFSIITFDQTTNAFLPDKRVLPDEQTEIRDPANANKLPLFITPGHYYVDGLLCENDALEAYRDQPYLKRGDDEELKKLSGNFLLYVDVWERFVTAADDPLLREVALGGADTAGRNKLIWQVKFDHEPLAGGALPECGPFNTDQWPNRLTTLRGDRARLRAMAKKSNGNGDENVCITSPEARFRGLENQLYRVQIHRSGKGMDNTGTVKSEDAATFKWSRDNGTTFVPVKEKIGDRLIVSGLRDLSRWFETGNWVEITHDALELSGRPGTLVRLAKVEGEVLTVDPFTTAGTIYDPHSKFEGLDIQNVKVRRWDQKQPDDDLLQDGAIPILEGDDVWIDLEDGVRIQFQQGNYVTGDYWLIPARVATGDVEWPHETVKDPADPSKLIDQPQALPPNGVDHHYAPLAAVTFAAGRVTAINDLRNKFKALAACGP